MASKHGLMSGKYHLVNAEVNRETSGHVGSNCFDIEFMYSRLIVLYKFTHLLKVVINKFTHLLKVVINKFTHLLKVFMTYKDGKKNQRKWVIVKMCKAIY